LLSAPRESLLAFLHDGLHTTTQWRMWMVLSSSVGRW
jgi:hypothetical protein